MRGEAVALLSGGLDSTVATALAHREVGVRLAVTVDYGQVCSAQESRAAEALCRVLDVEHRSVALDFMRDVGAGSGMLSGKLPTIGRSGLESGGEVTRESAKAVWVPNRNGLLIHLAAAFAESLGVAHVIVGLNREEAETFPDNSADFMNAINQGLLYSTANKVRVLSPTLSMSKVEIVHKAYELGISLDHIWPCYENGQDLCWRCESCLRLERALERTGHLDSFRASRSTP